jgi:tetratricopeptide (TPR) repeat protein
MNNLAWLITVHPEIKNRDTNEAIRLAGRACELANYKDLEFLDTLAAAYASAGQFDKAAETVRKAIPLAQTANQTDLVNDLSKKLQLYESGQAYHEPSPEKQKPDKPETTPKP